MGRKNQLADVDPFGGGQNSESPQRPQLSMEEADAALFGELARVESRRQTVRTLPVTQIYPDIKQARRALPFPARQGWDGNPTTTRKLFDYWIDLINEERGYNSLAPFRLDAHLWSEAIEDQQREEEALVANDTGPLEQSLLKVIALAVSIRQNGLANPITVHHLQGDQYRIETGERRWLAYHLLLAYYNGEHGRPQERETWRTIPASIVEEFSVWRQASENTARANLNAIGRARQFALLMIDLLQEQGTIIHAYESLAQAGGSDRGYYAQVIPYRVPRGKGELLANALGVGHRAAFSRARTLLGLPDEIWVIADTHDLPEDDLLRIAGMESLDDALEETRRLVTNVASRNNSSSGKKTGKPPALFTDAVLKRGKRLFSKQNELAAREIFAIRAGVGQANGATKAQIRSQIEALRECLNVLESHLDDPPKQ